MNQGLFVYRFVCTCIPVCKWVFKTVGVLIHTCIALSVCACLCKCVVCVIPMRGLNSEKSSNCRRIITHENLVFSHWCMSGLKFTLFLLHFFLVNFSYLSPDKYADYLLTCVWFTSLYKSLLNDKLSLLLERPTCTCACVWLFANAITYPFILLFFLKCRLKGRKKKYLCNTAGSHYRFGILPSV